MTSTKTSPGEPAPIAVFLSYSHDSAEHRRRVFQLANRLRTDGIDANLDQYQQSPPEGWPLWAQRQIREADFVLMVCTETYFQRIEGREESDRGHGVAWEGALITRQLYESRGINTKFIPILFEPEDSRWIPEMLRGTTPHLIHNLGGYEDLYRRLADPRPSLKPPLGQARILPWPRNPDFATESSTASETVEKASSELALEKALDVAYEQRAELVSRGEDIAAVDSEILELRRQLREGVVLRPGDRLSGNRFQLRDIIGEGGFATVWQAYDSLHQEVVALKVLHRRYGLDRSRVERFSRGARKMAELQHHGVARVIEPYRLEDGHHFFTMEFFSRGDLRRAVLAGELPPDRCLDIVLQVAETLEFAHSYGVIHRDVKPDNILLDRDFHPKLTDFDLVRAFDTTAGTRSNSWLGTFVYAAPEVMADAGDAGPPADVFGLGMTALFALRGADLTIREFRDTRPAVQDLECSQAVRNTISRAIEWELEKRFASVGEFRQELKRSLQPPGITDVPRSLTRAQQASRSIFRGFGRQGLGEGPGLPVAHGEQYLAGDASLTSDGEILSAVRPWLTLDAASRDHKLLSGRLEGWSCWTYRESCWVARLTPRIYSQRLAYIAHGRSWDLEACTTDLDPGAHLGRSEAFTEDPSDAADVRLPPTMVRPEQVSTEPTAAVHYLAQLLQAAVDKIPLVIAVPVAEFAAGKPLAALVSFARAALPAPLKKNLNIRIFTRHPELFLRRLTTDCLVIPQDEIDSVLALGVPCTVIDREGNVIRGKEPTRLRMDYAKSTVKRAQAVAPGLLAFSCRFGGTWQLVDEPAVRSLPILYNLAYALSQEEDRRRDLLKSLLAHFIEEIDDLPWERLIRFEEWQLFPRDELAGLILTTRKLPPGGRSLRRAVENAFAKMAELVDSHLDEWWDAGDERKLRRLLALLSRDPPLIGMRAAARYTSTVSLERIAALGHPEPVLAAEIAVGRIGSRTPESEVLGDLARSFEIFQSVASATDQENLGPEWASVLVRKAISWTELEPLAEHIFRASSPLQNWSGVAGDLVARMEDLDRLPPVADIVELARRSADDPKGLQGFQKIFDRAMERDSTSLTQALIAQDWWPEWRRQTRLTAKALHQSALEWLGSNIWRHQPLVGSEAWPTWQLVVNDLGSISASELEELRRQRQGPPWPRIEGRERDQILSLAARAEDLGVVADLHDMAGDEMLSLASRVVEAMTSGRAEARCWQELTDSLASGAVGAPGAEQPFGAIAEQIRSTLHDPRHRTSLTENGWQTFLQASARHPRLLASASSTGSPLPALELAWALGPPGARGQSAVRLVVSPGAKGFRRRVDWWQALFHGLERLSCEIPSVEDRPDVALALIRHAVDDLESAAQSSFGTAVDELASHPRRARAV